MRRKLWGGTGNGLPFRVTQNDGHKSKTEKRKSNYEKPKHSVQTNSSGSDPAAAQQHCLAAVFILAPTPAAARDMVHFNGTVSGYVDSQSGTECEPLIHVVNFGHANQLGAFTGTAGDTAPLRARSGSL